MAREDRLDRFVRDAIASGRTQPEIAQALIKAGWSEAEAEAALDHYADVGFGVAVPRPVSFVSARDFFTYALIFIALSVTGTFLALVFFF